MSDDDVIIIRRPNVVIRMLIRLYELVRRNPSAKNG